MSDTESSKSSSSDSDRVPSELKKNVIKFVSYDDKITKLTGKLRDLRKKKKPHEDKMIESLENLKRSEIEISDGFLKKQSKPTKPSPKITLIKSVLDENIKNSELVDKIMEEIRNKIQGTVKTKIQRTIKKKKRQKKSDSE